MLTESTNNLTYQRLSKEEMEQRGILGRLVGVCASFAAPTRNGRKYPEQLWENIFNSDIMKERISNGVCYGELGHPTDRDETDMEKVCICMPEEPKKGPDGKLRAVFDILDTPNGRILKSLCDYGSTLGISSRGSGDLEIDFDGQESVNPDTYNCEGFDIVVLPGVKEARLQYVNESLDKKRYNKTLRQKLVESINKESESNQKVIQESLDTLGVQLDEAKFGGMYNYTYGVHAAPNGTDKILAGSKTLEGAVSSGIKQAQQVFENPWMSNKEKFDYLNTMYLANDDEEEIVETEDFDNFIDNLMSELHSKGLDESVNNWDKLSRTIISEALTPQEKMDAWARGERKQNIKACKTDKLYMYRDICENSGYDEQVEIIDNELINRGEKPPTNNTNANSSIKYPDDAIHIKMSDDKSTLYVKTNNYGESLVDAVCSSSVTPNVVAFGNGETWFEIPKSASYGERIADVLFKDINSGFHEVITEDLVYDDEMADAFKNEFDIASPQEVADTFDKTVVTKDKIFNPSEDMADDNDMAIVNELQEALKLNKKLDEKIIKLQEKLSASYAKEMKLEEAIDNYKIKIVKLSNKFKENTALTEKVSKLKNELNESKEQLSQKKTSLHETMQRDAKERKSMQESLNNKDTKLRKLNEQLNEFNSEISKLNGIVDNLNEQLETAHKDNRQLKEKYSKKLDTNNKLIEKYKNIARTAVDKYINKQATVLGISANEIKNRLPESYSFNDIDKVCESLREYRVNINSLPFSANNKLNENVGLTAKNISSRTLVKNADDEISDTDIKLAERFMK